jgi:exodeoxyribonuclease III
MHHFCTDSLMSQGDLAVLHSALKHTYSSCDALRLKKKSGSSGSQRVQKALLKTHKNKLKVLLGAAGDNENESTFTDDDESEGDCDFDENLTHAEDSLSIFRGLVDTPLGQDLPVWVTTDTGNMTRLIDEKYASDMKFERKPLPGRSQFSIHSPGGGSDRITEMIVLKIRVKMRPVLSIDVTNHADTGDEVWRTIRMSFGVCSNLPVPILWGGEQMRKFKLLDLHDQKSLAFTLPDGDRMLTKSTSWLIASAEMREAMTKPLRRALGRYAPSRERLTNMVKGTREAFNMYTVLYPGRENVVKVNRRNACIDQGFNTISCVNVDELEEQFGDMIVVIDSVSNGEAYVVVRNCTDAALSLPAGRIRVLVTPVIALPTITPASSEFSLLREGAGGSPKDKDKTFKGLNWSRRDQAALLEAEPETGDGHDSGEGRVDLVGLAKGVTVEEAGVPVIHTPVTILKRPAEGRGEPLREPLTYYSWNVNGVGARMNPNNRLHLNRFISQIKKQDSDVFCLQELQLPCMEGFPSRVGGVIRKGCGTSSHQDMWDSFVLPFKRDYDVYLSLSPKSYAGQAMFVKKVCEKPEMSFDFGTAAGHHPNGRLIRAEFKRIVITSLYTPFNGQGRPDQLLRRRLWDEAMLKEATREDRVGLKHRIMLGDMNVARLDGDMTCDPAFWIGQGDQSVDICDRGFGGTTANERLRSQHWLSEGCLSDSFPPSTNDDNKYTFLGQGRFRNKGLRLDGFIVDDTILKSGGVKESCIVSPGESREGFMGSDHLPVTLTLHHDWFERETKLRRDFDSWLDTPQGASYSTEYEEPEEIGIQDRLAIKEMFQGSSLGPKTIRLEDGDANNRFCNSVNLSYDDEADLKGDGTRPEEFPEELWNLVDPEERLYVQGRWLKIADPEYRSLCVKQILDEKGLDIYDTKVLRSKFYEGGVEGEGWGEDVQLRATALANLDRHFPPRPDATETAKDVDAEIITVDERPFKCRPRKFSEVMQAFLKQKTDKMLRSGKLEHSSSSWCHGLVLVPYPDRIDKFMAAHGEKAMSAMFEKEHEAEVSKFFRLCIDLRMLNAKTVPDLFPLPRIDDLLGSVPRGCARYSISDLDDAFFCARIKEEYRYKTAFRTHDRHLQFAVLPQGWINSPSIFCRLIQRTFEGMDHQSFSAYVDDILNHTDDFVEHIRVQQQIYRRLRKSNLVMKLSKTHMNYPSIKFLGHILSKEGRLPDPGSVAAIGEWRDPTTTKEVRSFLGATLYYREYIYQYADIAMPLYDLIRKGVVVSAAWNAEVHGVAVQRIKDALTSKPVLMQIDNTRPFRLKVDACRVGRGIGGILEQQNLEGKWQPVSYYSATLNKSERNYSATELECKALHDCILHYHTYLQYIPHFEVFSDHNALRYLVASGNATTNGRLMRYLMNLQGYNFSIYYRSGWENCDADAVSRLKRTSDEPVYLSKDELDDSSGIITPGVLQRARRLDIRNKTLEAKTESILRKLDKKRLQEMSLLNDRILAEGVENLESDSGREKFLKNLKESGLNCDGEMLAATLSDMNLSPGPSLLAQKVGLTAEDYTYETDVDSVYDSENDDTSSVESNDPARKVFLASLVSSGVGEEDEIWKGEGYLSLFSRLCGDVDEVLEREVESSAALLPPLLVNLVEAQETLLDINEKCEDHEGLDLTVLEEARKVLRDRAAKMAGDCLCGPQPTQFALAAHGKSRRAKGSSQKSKGKAVLDVLQDSDEDEDEDWKTPRESKLKTNHPVKYKGGAVRTLPTGSSRTSPRETRTVDYSEEDKSQPNWMRSEVTTELHPLTSQLESLPLPGKGKVQVRESLLGKHAGYGLFAMNNFKKLEELCSYEGVEVTPEQLGKGYGVERDYVASAIVNHKTRELKYIDAEQFYSCFGRFANDPLDDHLVNAKISWNGTKMVLVAWKPIAVGDEIYLSYHSDYWKGRLDKLSTKVKPRLQGSQRIRFEQENTVAVFRANSTPVSLAKSPRSSELLDPPPDNLATRTRKFEDRVDLDVEKKETEDPRMAEEFSYENLEQTEELAEELQFLNGRQIIVEGRLYRIFQLRYEETLEAIIAFRKPLSGVYVKGDENAYEVYGPDGLYELSERYLIEHPGERETSEWPCNNVAWGKAQDADPSLASLRKELLATGRIEMVKKGFKYRLVPSDDVLVKMLVRVIVDKRRGEIEQNLVPRHLVKLTLKIHHEGFAHIGSNRMLETIKLRYFWSNMEGDIASHCAGCIDCKLRKTYQRRPKVPIMKYSKIRRPLDRVHIDLTGPLPRTQGGYRFILVIKDYLTKHVWLVPLKTKGALEVAEAFVRHFVCTAGIPETVVSDRGNEFVNSLLRDVAKILGINRISTTPYMPRSDGFVENHNKTMKDQLFNYCDTLKQDDWNIYLPTVQLQYNTTVSLATGYTPYMLMHGRECKMPSFSHMKSVEGDLKPTKLGNEFVRGMVAAISDYNRHAVEQTEKNKKRFNLKVKQPLEFVEYLPGQQFMLVRRPISEFNSPDAEETWKISMKLLERYEGPYTIIRMINPVLYDAMVNGKEVRVHAVNMKPF